LKEKGTTHWLTTNTDATNESGFTALPGGFREVTPSNPGHFAVFWNFGLEGYWWTSNPFESGYAWFRNATCANSQVSKFAWSEGSGFSVRCLKD
jgi:uncharacterized protein (TIGR02145 family)